MTKLPARLSNQQLKSTKRKKNPMIGYCPVINVAIKTMSATWYIVRHVMVLHCELPTISVEPMCLSWAKLVDVPKRNIS